MRQFKLMTIYMAAALALVACGQSEPEMPAATETPPAMEAPAEMDMPMDVRAALASAARSEEDRARDAGRRPADVIEFLGIEAGMSVVDLMAAGGWYSEVLSHAVGPDGSVDAQNPYWLLAFRDGAMGKDLTARIADRLSNVSRVDSSWAELAASGARYDAALSALNLHDAYLQSPEAAAELMSAVYTVLKPGGVFGVIEHAGNADVDMSALHRMNKDIAIELANAAGFVVEGDSDLLSNSDDDRMQSVFADGIRGKTDRFLLKLRKPAG